MELLRDCVLVSRVGYHIKCSRATSPILTARVKGLGPSTCASSDIRLNVLQGQKGPWILREKRRDF